MNTQWDVQANTFTAAVITAFTPSLGSRSSAVPTLGAQRSGSYTVSSSANANLPIGPDFYTTVDNCALLGPKIP